MFAIFYFFCRRFRMISDSATLLVACFELLFFRMISDPLNVLVAYFGQLEYRMVSDLFIVSVACFRLNSTLLLQLASDHSTFECFQFTSSSLPSSSDRPNIKEHRTTIKEISLQHQEASHYHQRASHSHQGDIALPSRRHRPPIKEHPVMCFLASEKKKRPKKIQQSKGMDPIPQVEFTKV